MKKTTVIVLSLVAVCLTSCFRTPKPEPDIFALPRQHYDEQKVKLGEKLRNARNLQERHDAICELMENADMHNKKEEVVFWCKELLKCYRKEDMWKPIPQETIKMIQDYGR
jgi:hypothetical protein